MWFCANLWDFVQKPAEVALKHLGINPPNLVAISPMDQFNIIWVKLPIVCAIFLGSHRRTIPAIKGAWRPPA
jgi:sec-independent protein translocase protein TatC